MNLDRYLDVSPEVDVYKRQGIGQALGNDLVDERAGA